MKRTEVAARLQILARALAALILIGAGTYFLFGLPHALLTLGAIILADAWLESWLDTLPHGRTR